MTPNTPVTAIGRNMIHWGSFSNPCFFQRHKKKLQAAKSIARMLDPHARSVEAKSLADRVKLIVMYKMMIVTMCQQ